MDPGAGCWRGPSGMTKERADLPLVRHSGDAGRAPEPIGRYRDQTGLRLAGLRSSSSSGIAASVIQIMKMKSFR